MLNLSDKDLDRLSREAAEEHDPGDIIGPRSWDKMEVRLDRQLGRVTPHAARGFYRLPFYYAPVVVLLIGASWYLIKNHRTQKETSSGSPPLTIVKPASAAKDHSSTSTQNPEQTDKSTSTLVQSSTPAVHPTASAAPATGAEPAHDLTGRGSPANNVAPAAVNTSVNTGASRTTTTANPGAAGTTTSANPEAAGTPAAAATSTGNVAMHTRAGADHLSVKNSTYFTRRHPAAGSHNRLTASSNKQRPAGSSDISAASTTFVTAPSSAAVSSSAATLQSAAPSSAAPQSATRQLSHSAVRSPLPTKRAASVSDSALRAFTAKTTPVLIHSKSGLHINRSLRIGVLLAPDYSSVSSESGDKPGSTIGLTADYQFAHRWYIGSGLLFSRKNYAAAPQDYHVPQNYYRDNGMTPNINYIKGSFTMLEIPLNLRYDFSVTGNTLFFATAGLSSYLMTSEKCSYYYQNFARQSDKDFRYDNQPDYLFSALNLSVGVEMGVSNTLSVLVAPYVKVPVRNIGFGQLDLSSVGINFVLDFTPVLSRRR